MIAREKPDFRAQLRDVPHKPGVYLMRDRFNRVIYVGKARNLRKRVGNYFMPSRKMTADLKTRALLDSIWSFETHTVNSEPEALLLEGRLIKEFRPRYNISFRDDKRFLLVKVDPRDEWPRFRLTRMKNDEGARYFGPFAHAGALRLTLAFMRKKFGVLTFGRGNPTERELKSSTYQVPMKLGELGPEQYRERVENACDFLSGQSKEMLAQLEEEMKAMAAVYDFEKAAELRNILDDLRKTTKPMHRYTRALAIASARISTRLPTLPRSAKSSSSADRRGEWNASTFQTSARLTSSRAWSVSSMAGRRIIYTGGFASGRWPVRTTSRAWRKWSGAATAVCSARPRRRWKRRTEPEDGELLIDRSAEFSQEEPVEALSRPLSEVGSLPNLIIVDGGKGQLGAACRELQRLRLHAVPIIGLAKEFEEIYRPGNSVPLRLPEQSGALRLLQRIRDEAHRFANTYHQLLMKRRIGESLLDDCPGVSQHRKQLLLQQFGSVARLKRASAVQIAETEGIGVKLAEQIVQFLTERG